MKLLKIVFLPLIVIFLIFYVIFLLQQSKKHLVETRHFKASIQQEMLNTMGCNDVNETNVSLKKPMKEEEFLKKWNEKFNKIDEDFEKFSKEFFN